MDTHALAELKKGFTEALDNDLNTSLAITAIYDVLKSSANGNTKLSAIADFDSVLCLGLVAAAQRIREKVEENAAAPELYARVSAMVEKRTQAKKARDFARADEIRDELTKMGVTIEDTREGTKFKIN